MTCHDYWSPSTAVCWEWLPAPFPLGSAELCLRKEDSPLLASLFCCRPSESKTWESTCTLCPNQCSAFERPISDLEGRHESIHPFWWLVLALVEGWAFVPTWLNLAVSSQRRDFICARAPVLQRVGKADRCGDESCIQPVADVSFTIIKWPNVCFCHFVHEWITRIHISRNDPLLPHC